MNPATGLDAEDPYSRRLRTRFDESRGVHIVQDTHISQCPHCGLASHEDAENIPDHVRQRIAELESQVVILTGKATDAGTVLPQRLLVSDCSHWYRADCRQSRNWQTMKRSLDKRQGLMRLHLLLPQTKVSSLYRRSPVLGRGRR